MSGGDLTRVKRILFQALELPLEDREAFIEKSCGNDPSLRDEVLLLVKADPQWMSYLDRNPFHGDDEFKLVGQKIGGYQLLREVGAGGMGAVFLAERIDGVYRQRVAVKILKKGMDSEQFLRRFNRERQIMANLNHPHIAKIMDGGTTPDGRPYFVMEFVDGERIDRYCRKRSISLRQRLKIFQKVCAAVSFAHRNLVVHCDIKPGNILVTDTGEPKLLDFGIAKFVEPETTRETTVTLAPLRALTPEYASPEQITGEAITTASDVYMLGILLFELLTERRPYQFEKQGRDAMRRVICQQEPAKPSRLLQASLKSGTSFKQDLDNIVAMALAKDPKRRYPSADQLSEDIARLLTGFPVRARKVTPFYYTLKFFSRHRFAVIAALSGLILLLGFSTTLFIQKRLISRERDRAEKVISFLQETLKASDPYQTKGDAITVRELLESATPAMLNDIEEPETRAALLDSFGVFYKNLEMFDKAERLLEEALSLRQRHLGERHRDTGKSHLHLGAFFHRMDDFHKAENHLQKSLATFERAPEENLETARALNGLAMVCYKQDRYDEGIGYLQRALGLVDAAAGSSLGLRGEIFKNMAQLYYKKADFHWAEAYHLQALDAVQKVHGKDHLLYASALDELGITYRRQEKFSQAEALFQEALEIRKKSLGPESLGVAASLNNLGWLQMKMGHYDEAENNLGQALELRRAALGPHSETVANAYNNLAGCQMVRGKYLEAAENFERAIDVHRRIGKTQSNTMANFLNNLSSILLVLERFERASQNLQAALAIRINIFGPEHPNVARIQFQLGCLALETHDYEQAETWLSSGMETIQTKIGPESAEAAAFLSKLAELKQRQGAWEQAETMGRLALSRMEEARGPNHPYVAETLVPLAQTLCLRQEFQDAATLLDRSLAILSQTHGPNHPGNAKALYHRALLHLKLGEAELALEKARLARGVAEPALGAEHRMVRQIREFETKAGRANF